MDRTRASHVHGRVHHTETTAAALLVVACVLSLPVRVQARAMEPARAPAPTTSLTIEGEIVVIEGDVHVSCGSFDFIGVYASCRVRGRLRMRASTDVRIRLDGALDASESFLLEGQPLAGTHAIARGSERELYVDLERSMDASPDAEESPYVLSAAFTRHPLLAEHRSMGTASDGAHIDLLPGARLEGVLRLDARSRGVVRVELGDREVHGLDRATGPGLLPTLSLHLSRDRTHEGPIANGGLHVLVGASSVLDGGDGSLVVAGGYEWILESAYFVSLTVGVVGDALTEAFVVEIASPAPLYIVPSFGAGVGVVARQLGDRAADAALRLRLSAQAVMFGGVVCDLDYWPSIGGFTLTIAGRISL